MRSLCKPMHKTTLKSWSVRRHNMAYIRFRPFLVTQWTSSTLDIIMHWSFAKWQYSLCHKPYLRCFWVSRSSCLCNSAFLALPIFSYSASLWDIQVRSLTLSLHLVFTALCPKRRQLAREHCSNLFFSKHCSNHLTLRASNSNKR